MEQIKIRFSVRHIILSLFIFSAISLVLSACKDDEPLEIGRNILPNDEILIAGIDTLEVELFTVSLPPVDGNAVNYCLLGHQTDPIFGELHADFMVDYVPDLQSGFTFQESLYPDSVLGVESMTLYLTLATAIHEDNALELDFDIFTLTEPIPTDALSGYEVPPSAYNPVPIDISDAEPIRQFETEPIDTIDGEVIYDTIIQPWIRSYKVTLSNQFAAAFIDESLVNDSRIYDSTSGFLNYFPGLYLRAAENSAERQRVIQIDKFNSYMIMKTSEINNQGSEVTRNNYFFFGSSFAKGTSLNLYRGELADQILAVLDDESNLHDHVYIQSLIGPQVLMRFPGLAALKEKLDMGAVINRAELIIPIDTLLVDTLYPSPLVLGIWNTETDTNIIDDGLINGYFNRNLNEDDRVYTFQISNYIHEYIRDPGSAEEVELLLYAGQQYTSNPQSIPVRTRPLVTESRRVVLNGSASENPPLLRIIYSKLPE